MRTVLGADPGCATLREADVAAHAVVAVLAQQGRLEGVTVATHLTRAGGPPRVLLTVEAALPGPHLSAVLADALGTAADAPDPASAVATAAAAHAARTSGRAVHFPGVEHLTGTLAVGELLAASAVERVRLLGGGEADPATPLRTREHVRPGLEDGHLVLVAQWAAGRALVPFEVADPTPCCADHARPLAAR